MAREIVSEAQIKKFQENLKKLLIDNTELFFENMAQLKPKDMCDVYLKMLPYAISKVPEMRELDDPTKQKLLLEETTRKATLIAGGAPVEEDTAWEDEEE